MLRYNAIANQLTTHFINGKIELLSGVPHNPLHFLKGNRRENIKIVIFNKPYYIASILRGLSSQMVTRSVLTKSLRILRKIFDACSSLTSFIQLSRKFFKISLWWSSISLVSAIIFFHYFR